MRSLCLAAEFSRRARLDTGQASELACREIALYPDRQKEETCVVFA